MRIIRDLQVYKRTIITILVCACFGLCVAQKPTKKDGQLLIEKTLAYLKVSDEMAFTQMWHQPGDKDPTQQIPFGLPEIKEQFKEMKTFLDTILMINKIPDKIKIVKLNDVEKKEFASDFKLSALFNYSEFYAKELSFFLVYRDEKWMYKNAPNYTTMPAQ